MLDPLTFLAVHAHPDDESICTGGTFARYAAEGIRTALVCCTRGEEGEIHDPALDPVAAKPRLGAIREAELRAAAAILGITELRLLGYRDSGMIGTAPNAHPGNFINADPDEAAERLAAIIRELRPSVVVTYDENGGYGHHDHKMAHRVTRIAIERAARDGDGGPGWQVARLYYTVISRAMVERINAEMVARGLQPPFHVDAPELDIRQLVAPDDAIAARVDVRPYHEQVREALRAHRTQIPEDDIFLSLPDDLAADVFATDHYMRAFTRVPAPAQETDLFAGSALEGDHFSTTRNR